MTNISWLASCLSKMKKLNKNVQEIKVWLPVFVFWHNFTYLSLSNILIELQLVDLRGTREIYKIERYSVKECKVLWNMHIG